MSPTAADKIVIRIERSHPARWEEFQVERRPNSNVISVFPLVRDLAVDRQKMFDGLKRVQAWIPVDGTYDLGPGPRQASAEQEMRYVLSTCMTCGCCLEVCPQVSTSTNFIATAARRATASRRAPREFR